MNSEDPVKEALMKISKSGSENLLKLIDALDIDISELTNLNMGRKLVEERYGFSEKEFIAVDFVFWVSYMTEREVVDLIVIPESEINFVKDRMEYIYSLTADEQKPALNDLYLQVINETFTKEERRDALYKIVQSLYLGQKINIIIKFYSSKKDPLIKLLRKIQDLRNHVSHGRLDMLIYDSYLLSEGRGQVKLIVDLMNVLQKN